MIITVNMKTLNSVFTFLASFFKEGEPDKTEMSARVRNEQTALLMEQMKNRKMTKQEFIQIAKAGFPERIHSFIDFDNCEMFVMGDVYRLHDKDVEFFFMLPKKSHLTLFIGEDNNFIQFTCDMAFNQLQAIKKMKQLKLITKF